MAQNGKLGSENRRRLYDNLVNDGFDLGSFDDFNKNLGNKEVRRNIYDAAKEAGWTLPDYSQFDSDMNIYHIGTKGSMKEVDRATYDGFIKRHPQSKPKAPAPQPQKEPGGGSVFGLPEGTNYSDEVERRHNSPNNVAGNYKDRAQIALEVQSEGIPAYKQDVKKPIQRDATSFGIPYKPDDQLTAAKRDEILKRNDFAARQMQQLEKRMREEEQRSSKPIVDTGSEAVNRHVIKTKGQWEDELEQGARRISSAVVVPAVDKAVKEFDKRADEIWGKYNEQSKFVDSASPFSVVTSRQANEAKDPNKILDYLKKQMEGVYNDKSFVEEVAREADKMGIDRGEYIEKVVKPQIDADLGAHLGATLMKREMPKSTAEYILGGLGNSIVGMLYNAMTETKGQRAYKNQAAAMTEEGKNPYYMPGTGARLTQIGVTFASDAPFFGLYGKVGGQVAKHVAEHQIKRLMAKGLSEGAARSVVGTALENSVGTRMKNYLMQHVISGSITMGGFNMTSEAARQVRDSEFSPGQILSSGAEGAATGAAFGLTGGAVQAVSQPLRGIARIGSKVAGFGAEAETMYATEELSKMVHGEEGFTNPFEGSVEALMKLGVMKVSSPGGLTKAIGEVIHPIKSNQRQRTGVSFSDDEEAYVRNSAEGKSLLDALSQMHPETAIEEVNGKKKLTADGEQLRQQLADRYNDFMTNTEIPYGVKMKVARVLGGLMPDAAHTPLETGADIIHHADGSVTVKTRDKDGNCMQDLKFDTFSDAEVWRDAHKEQFRLNDAVNMFNNSPVEARMKMVDELMQEYGLDSYQQAREMVDAALSGAMGTSFDNEQFLSIYDAIRRNAYPADEPHTKRNYWEGRKLSAGERHKAVLEAKRAEERLQYMDQSFADEVIGAADYADEKIAELAGRDEITGEQLLAAIDYFNKMSKVNGMMEEAANSVDQQVKAANDFIQRNTHTGSGQLIECEKGGNGYYVTAGDLKLNPNGSIDIEGSGDVVILRNKETGEIEVVNPMNVKVTAISDPKRMMADNDSMDGLRGRLMKEADDSISIDPETPGEPQNGEVFLGEDGLQYMAIMQDDGQGGTAWVKMAIGENGEMQGEPQPLDIDEYRKAKSVELDELNMPREEQPLAEEEIPTDIVLGVPDGEMPVSEGPGVIDRRTDEAGGARVDVAPSAEATPTPHRIPVDEKGRPQYDQATPEDTMAELAEKYGEEKARRMVATMAENTSRQLEELLQKDTSKMTDMADLAAHEDALAEAQRKADYWGQFVRKEEPKAEETVPELTETVSSEPERPTVPLKEEPQVIPETPMQLQVPVQPQPPSGTQPPVNPPQPTAEQKIAHGTVRNNIGKRFGFKNQDGTRSEVVIDALNGDDKVTVTRQDYDAQGHPVGEPYSQDLNLADVGTSIVNGVMKPALSTKEKLARQFKYTVGDVKIIDVLTEPEMQRLLDLYAKNDKEAIGSMVGDLMKSHHGEIIMKGRDERNQKVDRILNGNAGVEEKLRKLRRMYYSDVADAYLSEEALYPASAEEWVSALHSRVPKSGEGKLAYFSYERDGVKVTGMQDETGHGLKSGGDTKGYAPWLAPKGKGMSLQKYAEELHSQLPESVQAQYSDQDMRNAVLEVFGSAERPSDIPSMVLRRVVVQAEQAARNMEDQLIEAGPAYQKKPRSFADRLTRAKEQTNTEPTEAQKEKGNYKKGHISFGGYDFSIENPAGSVRRGRDADGREWEHQMHNTYGYILGRYGKDGDHLDMFINDDADLDNWNGRVYVVDQVNKDGSFDEHKCLYGFDSEEEARQAYLSNYEESWQGLGKITGVSKEKFDEWLDSSKRKMKPFAEHSIGKEAVAEDAQERMRQEEERKRKAAAREQVLRDAVIEHMQQHGIDVIVGEEGQRVLDEANGKVKMMGTTTRNRQNEISNAFEGKELTEKQQAVVDVFAGKTEKTSLSLTDKGGKSRNVIFRQGNERKAGVKHSIFRHYSTDANGYTADEVSLIPDIIANGDRKQDSGVRVSYKYEKDGVVYTVTTEVKGKDELFTNFYTNRKPTATEQGTSNTENRHVQPQQTVSEEKASNQTPQMPNGDTPESARTNDLNASSGAKVQQNTETAKDSEEKISFHKVEAGQTLDELNNGPTLKRYRAMQLIDGKLYPPMSAKVGKEMREPTEIGVWEQAEERPDLIDKNGKFKLDKGQKGQGSVPAAYNPYFHTSTSGLNDQFTSAYKRPELVVVEVEIPESELTSGYKAQGAKDAVGDTDWHSGPVNGSLPDDRKRTVTLSRYAKVNRIVPDSEVADMIAQQLDGTNVEVPYNVVTPALRKELEARGVRISDKPSGTVTEDVNGNPIQKKAKFFKTPDGEAYGYTYKGKIYIDPRIANSETPLHEYGHLWAGMKRASAPEEWAEMKKVLLGDRLVKPIIDKVREEYPELTAEGREDDFVEELLTQFSGRRGAERLREIAAQVAQERGGVFGKAEAVTAMQRLKNVLNRFWESIARMMGVKYRNANDIADMMMRDFLNGVNPMESLTPDPSPKGEGREFLREGEPPVGKTPSMRFVENMNDEAKSAVRKSLEATEALPATENTITKREGVSARNAAMEWADKNIPEPKTVSTEIGDLIINKKSISDSLAHGFSQSKLDAIPTLVPAFEEGRAVYIGSGKDVNGNPITDHYFAYPIDYRGKREYVFCRTREDQNTHRLYIHEVITGEDIEKGQTLQSTAPEKPRTGLPLYRNIMSDVFGGKGTKKNDTLQEKTEENAELLREGEARQVELGAAQRKYTPKQMRERQAFAERQWHRAHEWADDTVKKLNLDDKVKIVDGVDELEGWEKFTDRKKRAKGWYDADTDSIVIVMGNHRSPTDVVKTILHEGVVHHGLRKLFGDNFDTFLDNAYKSAHSSIQEEIGKLAGKYDNDVRKATEEYLGKLAEDTDFENADNKPWVHHWFNQIKRYFLDMLDKIGLSGFVHKGRESTYGDLGLMLTDNELRYILWRSYKNLSEPGRYRNVFRQAEDVAMRNRLAREVKLPVKGHIEDEVPKTLMNHQDEVEIRNRVAEMSLDEAQDAYKRIDDMMRDERGLDLDEQFEANKAAYREKNGLKGIGQFVASDLQRAMDKYGSGMVELRWALQDRIEELGGSYAREGKELYREGEEELNNRLEELESEKKAVPLQEMPLKSSDRFNGEHDKGLEEYEEELRKRLTGNTENTVRNSGDTVAHSGVSSSVLVGNEGRQGSELGKENSSIHREEIRKEHGSRLDLTPEECQQIQAELAAVQQEKERRQQAWDVFARKYHVAKDGWIWYKDYLKAFDDMNTDPEAKRLMDKVVSVLEGKLGELSIKAGLTERGNHNDGLYGDVEISKDWITRGVDDNEKASTLLHELIHKVTFDNIELYKNPVFRNLMGKEAKAAVKELYAIHDALKEQSPDVYGAKSVHEMVADMGKQELRQALESVVYDKNKNVTLWDRFKEAVKSFFGFGSNPEMMTDADRNALAALDKLMEAYNRPRSFLQRTGRTIANIGKKAVDKLSEEESPSPELTPEERQYWKQWDDAMKKWKERHGIAAEATGPGERPQFQRGETAVDFGNRMMKWYWDSATWKTAPKMEDYHQVRTDKDAVEAARENEEKYPDSQFARMRRVAAEALRIRHAMSRQKAYDKATVKAVTDFAKDFMRMGFGDHLGRGELERMLSSVKNATGAKDIRKHVDNIMNILVDNQLRNLENSVVKLSSVKELSKTAQGVEKQGRLELKGQRMIQEFRKAREERLTADEIRERMAEVAEKMTANSDEAPMREQEYEGLAIALQYAENVDESRKEYAALDREYKDAVKEYKQSGRSYQAQKELLESLEQAMMENKIERLGMFGDIIGRLHGNIQESIAGAKEFRERELQRINKIHKIANFDLAGKDMGVFRVDEKGNREVSGKPINFFLSPTATFEQLLKQFGSRNANGEGELYDYYMRNWMESVNNAYLGEQKAKRELDAKAHELFGDKVKRWSDLYKISSEPAADVTIVDQGESKTLKLTQGNLLYIYMVDKMSDGRMKLRKMGITEEQIEQVKDKIDPRLLQLGDWLQDDYLAKKRTEYNKVHERMFGAPMAAIEHYFHIRILSDARVQEEDVNVPDSETLPSTITGSIIKRTRNALPLDILGTDAISLALEHVEDMERWAAQAEWNRDVNTLLSYTTFRNKVKNMKTMYGSGDALWNTFKDTAKIAAGTYRPMVKPGSVDKTISNIAKGVTAAKINFRVYTAFKQILSAPAFFHDVRIDDFAKHAVNPYGSWKWAMENMPVFRKRWESRQIGDTRLMNDETDWKLWKSDLSKLAMQLGMSPNALVDGVTCAVGARAIYDTRYRKYKKIGASDEVAHKRAMQDAEIGYNLTQQSSEGAFVSAIQKDRTVAANMLSVFRNSSMAYTRQWIDAVRNLKRRTQKGYKEDSINFMTRQFMEQLDLDEAKARKAAEYEYAHAGRRDVARMLNMMFGVTVAWNLGASLPYLLLGDDDKTKKEMLTDALVKGMMAGPTEGFAAGNIWSDIVGRMTSEQTRNAISNEGWGAGVESALKQAGDYEVNPLPLMADIQSMIKKMGYDKYAAAQDVFNIGVQSAVGVNPQTFTDMWNAAMDYGNPSWMPFTDSSVGNNDLSNSKEIALFIMRVLNAPTDSWRNKYIDELGMDAEDAKKLSYDEMARRYANYKHWKDAPLMGWLRSDEARQEKMDKIREQFDKAVDERIARLTDEEIRDNLGRSKDIDERRRYAKLIHSRIGGDGEDSKNAKEDWQRNYQELMQYDDINEDELLSKKKAEAKARGDDRTVKAIGKKLDLIRDMGKKKLGKGDDAERMARIRQWRREAIEAAMRAEEGWK